MGKAMSRSYSPNPPGKAKKCCGPCLTCSCSPFSKGPKTEDVPLELPKPPIYVIGDKDDKIPADTPLLVVKDIYLSIKTNSHEHRTNEYHLVEKADPQLVVRRGQTFKVKITFSREFRADSDVINFVFTAKDSKNPTYAQNTLVSIPVFSDVDPTPKEWSAKLLSSEESSITVQISTPCDTIVGAWGLDLDTKLQKDESKVLRFSYPDPVFIIFNPWCKDDSVYLDDEDKRKEYVLNDSGLIWRGSHSRLRPTPWNYAQFEESILECAIYLLNYVGHLRKTSHSDPVLISRHLSAVANAQDENGVVEGNWTGDYKGGEPPTKWGGSKMILQQFYKTQKPVKFGQCWVFSGVLTTVCRSLGIPCRPVTNFSSAHDTHESLTIDIFCDDDGNVLDNLSSDSIWNFHVWNEVWMDRPDIEPGHYGGWQAIDCTPQEESDGSYRCGPASLAAVKRGEIKRGYDTDFLFAEVNADKIFWRYWGPTQPLKLISKQQEAIGMFISTKAVGSFEREDITHEYKYPEKSQEERTTMIEALRQSGSMYSRYYLNDEFEDIQFDFELYDDIIIGDPFKVVLKVKNKSSTKDYDITATLRVNTMFYNGQIKTLIKRKQFETRLKAATESSFLLEIKYSDYETKLEDQYAFHIAAMAKVKETDFEYFGQDDFRVRMPDIVIDTEGDIVQGEEFSVKLHFVNPLPKPIRRGEFVVEGAGLGTPVKIKLPSNVNEGEEVKTVCKLTPTMHGSKTIVAKFTSSELRDVDGFKTIYVSSKSTEIFPNSDAATPPSNDIGNGRETDNE